MQDRSSILDHPLLVKATSIKTNYTHLAKGGVHIMRIQHTYLQAIKSFDFGGECCTHAIV